MLLSLAMLLANPAAAQDDPDEFDFIKSDDEVGEDHVEAEEFSLFEEEEEFDIAPPTQGLTPSVPVGGLPPLPFKTDGAAPLGDNFAGQLVYGVGGSVVVELPVLVAQAPGEVGETFWLHGSALIDGSTVGEAWLSVTPEQLNPTGPSLVFVKLQLPADSGQAELRVARAEAPGGESTELFSRVMALSAQP
jgi:hypothetical protein